ncbi:hypothetical protein IC582_023685 [Cucumis melo]
MTLCSLQSQSALSFALPPFTFNLPFSRSSIILLPFSFAIAGRTLDKLKWGKRIISGDRVIDCSEQRPSVD